MFDPLRERRAFRKNIDLDELYRLSDLGVTVRRMAEHFDVTEATIRSRLDLRRYQPPAPAQALPSGGVTDATKSFFKGSAAAFRSAGLDEQADEIESDSARIDELAKRYGFVAHSTNAD